VDRTIVMTVLLLVGLTWLLYKLTILLAPKGDPSPPPEPNSEPLASPRKLIHQRLRK
jgi:hypothetical protein